MNIGEGRESRWALAIFVVVLAASCVFHLQFRTVHYQEYDSTIVYNLVHDVPASYAGSAKVYGSLLGKVAAFRLRTRDAIVDAPLPQFVRSAFAVPFGSTYSLGAGLFYGVLDGPSVSYDAFMSRAVAMTIILFHLIALCLFLIFRRLRFHPLASLTAAFGFLFAISNYSYGYHLGSTVWNMAVTVAFIWFFVMLKDSSRFLVKISAAATVLVFFSYLIIFWWVAALAQYIVSQRKEIFSSGGEFVRNAWRIIRSQLAMFIALIVTALLLYPPGQGDRLTTSLRALPLNFYYIVLNFVSIWNRNAIFDAVQCVIALFLIVAGVVAFGRSKNKSDGARTTQGVVGWFFLFVGLAMAAGVLGFAPDRHILFVAPAVFVALAFGLDVAIRTFRIPASRRVVFPIAALFAIVGLSFVVFYSPGVADVTREFRVPSDVGAIVVADSSIRWYDQDFWQNADGVPGVSIPVTTFDPAKIVSGTTYLYLSERNPFPSSTLPNAKIYGEEQFVTDNYFIPYNPNAAQDNFDYPNNLYAAEFRVD